MTTKKRGIVFGVFDGLHEGHRHFLTQAAANCDELVVVVTIPEVVQLLKNHLPKYSYDERVGALQTFNPNFILAPSDRELGTWEVINTHQPDVIFLGYDQAAIANELRQFNIPHIFLLSHEPDKYKSSYLL